MPRNDKPTYIEELISFEELEELNAQGVPHYFEIDPNIDVVGITLPVADKLMELDSPIESIGLFFIYLMYKKLHDRMPTVKDLSAMGAGSAPRIARIRKILIEAEFLKIHIVRKNGKIVAKRTYTSSPKLRNLNIRKHGGNIINNINTPDSEGTESGCVCSSCNCSKEKETPHKKELPREQDFNALWSINRRKINKDEARKAWKSKPVQKSLPPKDVLLEAYESDAQDNKWDEADEKYVPHLSTWLRNRRWKNHTGEPKGEEGGIHIMDQLRKSDGIESPRQLRTEITEAHTARTGVGFGGKTSIRAYVKWLAGSDSPSATSKDSIKDVLITNRIDSRYWDAYITAGMPGMSKTEEF